MPLAFSKNQPWGMLYVLIVCKSDWDWGHHCTVQTRRAVEDLELGICRLMGVWKETDLFYTTED